MLLQIINFVIAASEPQSIPRLSLVSGWIADQVRNDNSSDGVERI